MIGSPSAVVISLIGAIGVYVPAQAQEIATIGTARSERTNFSDDEIIDGFFKLAFGAELQFGKRVERIRKFDEPVRVFIFNEGEPTRGADIAAVVADIRSRIANLDLATTNDPETANLAVMLVRKQDFKRTIRSVYGRDKGRKIERALDPRCLSGFGKDASYRITHAEVIIPVDSDEATFFECAYEEVLQALGPINDDRSVPWTMFNDGVQVGFFDVYDQYILNLLYDRRVRPGMTKDKVRKLLPKVLPAVRQWVNGGTAARGAHADEKAITNGRNARPLGVRQENSIIQD